MARSVDRFDESVNLGDLLVALGVYFIFFEQRLCKPIQSNTAFLHDNQGIQVLIPIVHGVYPKNC